MCRKSRFLGSLVVVLCLFGNAWGLVWGDKDIGNPGIAGSHSEAAGVWNVSGSGHDIWGTGDGFYYVFRPMSGDGVLEVNLASMTVPDFWTKVGVMVRETSDADSKHAMIAMTGHNEWQFSWRPATGGDTLEGTPRTGTLPRKLKITRTGDVLQGYAWVVIIPFVLEDYILIGEVEIPMNTDVLIGLAVCSHDNGALCDAVYDMVNWPAVPYEKPWDLSPADGTTNVSLTPTLSWLPGDSATAHDVYLGTDAGALALVATKPLGDESYSPGPLETCTVYYWQIVEQPLGPAGPVLSFETAGPAYNPSPPDGAEEVPLDVVLSWLPGCKAAQHDVYLGTEPAALDLVATKPLGDESYNPGALEICTVYYWRIDEVEADGTTVHTGDVWSFTTVCKIAVDIDIKPRSCPNPLNVKSQGVLPVAILGSEDFDISTIDAVSVRLAGVAPIRSSYEDVAAPLPDKDDECECTTEGPDGYTDLNLKFETQEIVESIGELTNGEVLVLNLTGLLFDGTAIEGQDCVISVGNASRRPKGDLNVDGVVNMKDLAIIAGDWLQKAD